MSDAWPDETGTLVDGVTPITFSLSLASEPAPSSHNLGSPSFNSLNHGYARSYDSIVVTRGGATLTIDFAPRAIEAIRRAVNAAFDGFWDNRFLVDNYIHWDDSDRAHTIVTTLSGSNVTTAVLLWSDDFCATWSAVALSRKTGIIEKRDTNNASGGLPTIITFDQYSNFAAVQPGIAEPDNLYLERLTTNSDGTISVGTPVLVTNESLLVPQHSGGGNSTLTTASKIFIVYPTNDASAPGTEAKIRQFDIAGGSFDDVSAVTLGRSNPPANQPTLTADNHDTPVISRSSDGKLHVVLGAHHGQLRYTFSTAADSVSGGWSALTDIGWDNPSSTGFGDTYLSLNCLQDDNGDDYLIIISRLSAVGYRKSLAQIRIQAGTTSEYQFSGQDYREITRPELGWYGVWHHRVTMDRKGNLYIFAHWGPDHLSQVEAESIGLDIADGTLQGAVYWFSNNRAYIQPTVWRSTDQGLTWQSMNAAI